MTPSTPREREDWWGFLAPLAEQMRRRQPVMSEEEIRGCRVSIVRLLSEQVATCPACCEPIRRCDPRRLDAEDRLAHVACLDRWGRP